MKQVWQLAASGHLISFILPKVINGKMMLRSTGMLNPLHSIMNRLAQEASLQLIWSLQKMYKSTFDCNIPNKQFIS